MQIHSSANGDRPRIRTGLLLLGSLLIASGVRAQGCMPIRYTSPSLGARDNAYLNRHQWQFGFAYRWLHADRYYIDHAYRPDAAPHAQPVEIRIHTLTLNATYAFTSRFSLSLQLPMAIGDESTVQPDLLRHAQKETGIGDMSLLGNFWLLAPLEHSRGNVSLTVGVKAPTGKHDGVDQFHTAAGLAVVQPVNNTIQAGDGAWGIVLQTDAFQRVANRLSVYVDGTYLVSPRAHADLIQGPAGTTIRNFVAVSDEYSAHAGFSYAVLPRRGFVASLGGRIDGVPVHDLMGGGAQYFRRPGYAVYLEPGVAFTMARSPLSRSGSTFSISVPVTIDRNRQWSVAERQAGRNLGGDFATYLIFFNYSLRMR
jgi:hypothetical protein